MYVALTCHVSKAGYGLSIHISNFRGRAFEFEKQIPKDSLRAAETHQLKDSQSVSKTFIHRFDFDCRLQLN